MQLWNSIAALCCWVLSIGWSRRCPFERLRCSIRKMSTDNESNGFIEFDTQKSSSLSVCYFLFFFFLEEFYNYFFFFNFYKLYWYNDRRGHRGIFLKKGKCLIGFILLPVTCGTSENNSRKRNRKSSVMAGLLLVFRLLKYLT